MTMAYKSWLDFHQESDMKTLEAIEEFELNFEYLEKYSLKISNEIFSKNLNLYQTDDEIERIVEMLELVTNFETTDHKIFNINFAKNIEKTTEFLFKDYGSIFYGQKITKVRIFFF